MMDILRDIGAAVSIFGLLVLIGKYVYWRCTREPTDAERWGPNYHGPGYGED